MNVVIWQKSISNDYVLVYLQQKVPRLYQTFNNSFWKQSREPFKFSWNQVIRHLNWLSSAISPSLPTFFEYKNHQEVLLPRTHATTPPSHIRACTSTVCIWKFNYELKFFSWNQFHEIFSWNWFHEIFHEIDFTKFLWSCQKTQFFFQIRRYLYSIASFLFLLVKTNHSF